MDDSGSSAFERYSLDLHLAPAEGDYPATPQKTYEMQTPAARHAAERLATQLDLGFVRDACELLSDLPPQVEVRETLARALWSSAVVAYARCFNGGMRRGLTEKDVGSVPRGDEAVEFHRKILALRSKHIAHSVNPSEFIKIGVMVGTLGPNEEGVTGLVSLFSSEWEAHPDTVDGLRRLANLLLDVVMRSANEHGPALFAAAKEAGLDEVRTWPELTYEHGPVDPETMRKR